MNARAVVNAVIPAARRAASTAAKPAAAGPSAALYALPMFASLFGFGGIIWFHDTGALKRIRRSFDTVPH